jgi:hypothetical protein
MLLAPVTSGAKFMQQRVAPGPGQQHCTAAKLQNHSKLLHTAIALLNMASRE